MGLLTVSVNQENEIQIEVEKSNGTCYNRSDASVELKVTGGIAPYEATWSNYATGLIQQNLSPGLYQILVSDARGCSKSIQIEIQEEQTFVATTASSHDSTQFDKLTKNESKAIFADSGYMSKERKRDLRTKGIFGGIIERRVRGQLKLREKQSRNNKRFAKIRSLVELPFAFIKHHMNFKVARYLGIFKNQQHFYLLAACYNLRRVPNMIKVSG